MTLRLLLSTFLALFAFSASAQGGSGTAAPTVPTAPQSSQQQQTDTYVPMTYTNILNALLRFGALDVRDNKIIDDYSLVAQCDLFTTFYDNDFKWNKIRAAVRESIKLNLKSFPIHFSFGSKVQLYRYDFKNRMYMFTEASAIRDVNSFSMHPTKYACGTLNPTSFPSHYHMILDIPLLVLGLPLNETDADALLSRLTDAGDADRVIYVQFKMHVVHVSPLIKNAGKAVTGIEAAYFQAGAISPLQLDVLKLDVQLDSADFYEDKKFQKLIYSYTN